jgi:hypothetical protein
MFLSNISPEATDSRPKSIFENGGEFAEIFAVLAVYFAVESVKTVDESILENDKRLSFCLKRTTKPNPNHLDKAGVT